jgi:hypothetical protein
MQVHYASFRAGDGGGLRYPTDREEVNHFARTRKCGSSRQTIMIHSSSSSAVRDKQETRVLDKSRSSVRDESSGIDVWTDGQTEGIHLHINSVMTYFRQGLGAPKLGPYIQSPVDMALDSARLRPGVDCALDAGHGGVPCMENLAGLELYLNYLPAL